MGGVEGGGFGWLLTRSGRMHGALSLCAIFYFVRLNSKEFAGKTKAHRLQTGNAFSRRNVILEDLS